MTSLSFDFKIPSQENSYPLETIYDSITSRKQNFFNFFPLHLNIFCLRKMTEGVKKASNSNVDFRYYYVMKIKSFLS